jgi:hypothetical protein
MRRSPVDNLSAVGEQQPWALEEDGRTARAGSPIRTTTPPQTPPSQEEFICKQNKKAAVYAKQKKERKDSSNLRERIVTTRSRTTTISRIVLHLRRGQQVLAAAWLRVVMVWQ